MFLINYFVNQIQTFIINKHSINNHYIIDQKSLYYKHSINLVEQELLFFKHLIKEFFEFVLKIANKHLMQIIFELF